MKSKTQALKLNLRPDVLRLLTPSELENVQGGIIVSIVVNTGGGGSGCTAGRSSSTC